MCRGNTLSTQQNNSEVIPSQDNKTKVELTSSHKSGNATCLKNETQIKTLRQKSSYHPRTSQAYIHTLSFLSKNETYLH